TELALRGEWEAARTLHYRLLPLMEANFLESNPGPVKAALALLGLVEERYRLPLVPVQEQTRARLAEALAAAPRDRYDARDRALFAEFRAALARGAVRAAERRPDGTWAVNAWVKRGILLGF